MFSTQCVINITACDCLCCYQDDITIVRLRPVYLMNVEHLLSTENVTCLVCADIEWPEGDEALSDGARGTIEVLLSNDPQARPDAVGQRIFLSCLCACFCVCVSVCLSDSPDLCLYTHSIT